MRARAVFFSRSTSGVESGAVAARVVMEIVVGGGAKGKKGACPEEEEGCGEAREKKMREWRVAQRREAERE
jgi:hypothetical protein